MHEEIPDFKCQTCGKKFSARRNTIFVERINLTLWQRISKLTRRTWGPAKFTPELMEHLEWWRSYYHFVQFYESLEEELARPMLRKGKQQVRKFRKRTPAMMAGRKKMDSKGTAQLSFTLIVIELGGKIVNTWRSV